ncbi:hypothetical protein DFS33DRAFT_1380489 [Desarmillaria ectypa]|nr:hypothetical protein DFS33DRAFT_1380489 [Desarmillaria ectypa]
MPGRERKAQEGTPAVLLRPGIPMTMVLGITRAQAIVGGSNTSLPQPQNGGDKPNPEKGSSPGNNNSQNGSSDGSGSHNAGSSGGTAGQNGSGEKNPGYGQDGGGNSQNSASGKGGNDNAGGGGQDSSPHGSCSSSQAIPVTTPPSAISQTQPAAALTSTSSNDGSPVNIRGSSQLKTSISTSPGYLNSATEIADGVDNGSTTVGIRLPPSTSVFISTGINTYPSSISGSPTTSVSVFTTTGTTATISPSDTGNIINAPKNTHSLIGGIIGGIIAFLALFALLLFLFIRKRRHSSLFNFDAEKFVGVKCCAESTVEASVPTAATHLVSPTVVKRTSASEWEDDECHDDEVSGQGRHLEIILGIQSETQALLRTLGFQSFPSLLLTPFLSLKIPFTTLLGSPSLFSAIQRLALLCLSRKAQCRKPLGCQLCQFKGFEVRFFRMMRLRYAPVSVIPRDIRRIFPGMVI